MKEKGLTVQYVTPELEADWRKAAEAFYPKIKGRLVPADVFEEVEWQLNSYRASQAGSSSSKP